MRGFYGSQVKITRGGLFAAFCGKWFDPLVVKDCFLRGGRPVSHQRWQTDPPRDDHLRTLANLTAKHALQNPADVLAARSRSRCGCF